MKKSYISTAVDYVNSFPHLGHCFEKIQADVVARYNRKEGRAVFFLTGTDENSLKNVQAAQKEKITIKELVDKNAHRFFELKKVLNLSIDDFIRTTEKRNIVGAQKLWKACKKDIYKKAYKGLYCVGCEEFYKKDELVRGLCPEHKTKPVMIEEENYFFRLSKYQDQLKKIIEKDEVEIVPNTRKNELLSFINSGLNDFCISRSAKRGKGWGISVPGDPSEIMWTWFDALSNYINALGYAENSKEFKKWWQKNDDKLHIIGKGILRFHGIYWIAILLSAKISLPEKIFVHGYITVDGQKMSKSLGNVIDPFELVKKYGTDAVRYYLLREIPSAEDGDFTYEKFEGRYNSDLAGGIGNLILRTRTMADSKVSQGLAINNETKNSKLKKEISRVEKEYTKALEGFKFNDALKAVWELISFCDKYINDTRPWQKEKGNEKIISDVIFALDKIAVLLQPFLPETADKIINQLKNKPKEALFPRIGVK